MYAFESFSLEASEREIDEVIHSVNEDPEYLLNKADWAIKGALEKASKIQSEIANEVVTETKALHKGLQALVKLLRRNQGFNEVELAEAARVDVEEIMKIEQDINYSPSPRTIFQLEEFFKLEPRTLVLVSGAITKHSSDFTNEVLEFAANSKEMGKLTREEKKLLNEFVRFLSKEVKKMDKK